MGHAIGTRLEVTIDEVLFRDGEDPYEPKWAIAVEADGTSHLLYGVRHEIAPQVGMRAVMEYRTHDHWVFVEEIQNQP
ncbi:MAG: hypothetical protein SH850_14295 [Planctomycetaceae bacterium]|nr:hypothetical protein [Planctomycetaceae bacterium]